MVMCPPNWLSRRAQLVSLGAAALLGASCGARSTLQAGDASPSGGFTTSSAGGDAGGTAGIGGASSSSGSGAGGGAGGGTVTRLCGPIESEPPPAACPALALAPGLLTPTATDADSDQPTLVDV